MGRGMFATRWETKMVAGLETTRRDTHGVRSRGGSGADVLGPGKATGVLYGRDNMRGRKGEGCAQGCGRG